MQKKEATLSVLPMDQNFEISLIGPNVKLKVNCEREQAIPFAESAQKLLTSKQPGTLTLKTVLGSDIIFDIGGSALKVTRFIGMPPEAQIIDTNLELLRNLVKGLLAAQEISSSR